MDAADKLSKVGIDVEIVDVQSLLPFDINAMIVESLKKTNRVLFLDEDVPGGASAYMMQEVIEKQGGYYHLDSPAQTLSGKAHRPAYRLGLQLPSAELRQDHAYARCQAPTSAGGIGPVQRSDPRS